MTPAGSIHPFIFLHTDHPIHETSANTERISIHGIASRPLYITENRKSLNRPTLFQLIQVNSLLETSG